MVLGTCTVLDGDGQGRGARLHLRPPDARSPGRGPRARTRKELAATLVLALPLDEASVKVSAGDPDDDPADLDRPVWAGVVPLGRVVRRSGGRARPARGPPRPRLRAGLDAGDARDRPPTDLSLWWDTLPDRTGRAAACRPARRTATSTSPSSAAATPGCGPRTTSPRPTRRSGSRCSSARSPASAPRAATAAGAPRSSPPRSTRSRARPRAEAAVDLQRALFATVDEVGRRRRGRGHRLPLRQGRHAAPGAHAASSWSGPRQEVADARPWGFGEEDFRCCRPTRRAAQAAATGRARRAPTPRTARRSTRRGWSAASRRRSSGSASRSTRAPPSPRSSPAVVRTARGIVRAPYVVRATEGYTPGLPGHERAIAPVYSLMIATEPLPPRRLGADRPRLPGDVQRPAPPDHLRPAHRRRPLRLRRPRGAVPLPARRSSPSYDREPRVFAGLRRGARRLLPRRRRGARSPTGGAARSASPATGSPRWDSTAGPGWPGPAATSATASAPPTWPAARWPT